MPLPTDLITAPPPAPHKEPKSPPTRGVRPDSADVRGAIERFAARDPRRVRVRTIEYSRAGRPIDAVTLTDPSAPDTAKQHALIVAGQHGNEESGRLIALALIEHLLGPAGQNTLRNQKIVVMPNVNPDGAECDSYHTPEGVLPNMDHGPGGATTPEGLAVERVAAELCPEVFVDMHARGHAGCSYDMVLYPQTRAYTEDDNLYHHIAAVMSQAGEAAGLPHITHPLSWWTEPSEDSGSTTAYAYRNFKSIVMLTESAESNEHAYPQELTARVGVARLMALLNMGNERHPKLPHPGYPNALVLGMFSAGVLAAGETAAQRRRSRVAIWRRRGEFVTVRPQLPEPSLHKTLLVDYQGAPLEVPVGLMLRAAGHHQVRDVRCRGRRLEASPTDGYYTYHDQASTYVVAVIPRLDAGLWDIEADLI